MNLIPSNYHIQLSRIIVLNLIGQKVATDATNNLFSYINLKGHASGIYMVQLIN